MKPLRWVGRNLWWLTTAVAAAAASAELAVLVAGPVRVSRGDLITWVAIALAWMLIQFSTEVRARRLQAQVRRR